MAVVFKKAESPTLPEEGKKPVTAKKLRTRKQPATAPRAKNPKGLEESLIKYHDKTDSELADLIVPHADRAANITHRLDLEQQEARLVLLHRMLIRKVPPAEIRAAMNVGPAMYFQLKTLLEKRLRLDVSKVDVPYLIGDSLAFYDEVRSMALTMASSAAIKDPRVKVSSMALALKAELDKNAFLTSCGVYSAPVVEHIVRGMVGTGNFSTYEGQARTVEAEEVSFELALRLKNYAKQVQATVQPPA
jgi:hypothetical protein